MNRSRLGAPAAALVSLLAAGSPTRSAAAGVVIRLVDSRASTPLEYWQKDLALPNGGWMYFRAPTAVGVDGKVSPYARYVELPGLRDGGGGKAVADELLKEMDGEAAAGEAAIRSNRATEVLSGFKAEVRAELADGAHVLAPGGLAFRVRGGVVESDAPALRRSGAGGLELLCAAVDLNFVPAPGADTLVTPEVASGDAVVFAGESLKAGAEGCALRLYLPASGNAYRVRSAYGEASFIVRSNGVEFAAPPRCADGVRCETDGFALSFLPASGPPSAASGVGAAAASPELYAFTDRNRETYVEGETVPLSVRGWALAEGAWALRLRSGSRTLTLPVEGVPGGASPAFELQFPTALLAPGDYELAVERGGVRSNPLPLKLVPAVRATGMKLFGWYKWGSDSYETADLEAAARNGLNLVCQGAGHGQGGTALTAGGSPFEDWSAANRDAGKGPVFAADTGRSERWHGTRAPPELVERKLVNDAGAEFLLANGIDNLPQLGGLILYFNVGSFWREHAFDRYQAVAHLGQEWRRFPNFAGMVHCVGDGPTPATSGMVWGAGPGSYDIVHDRRMAKLKEAFEFKVGKIETDDTAAAAEFRRINDAMRGAIGFGVGMDAGLKVEGDAARKLEWLRWINDLYPECFRNERAALSAMAPSPIVNCGWTWGGGAGSGMYAQTFYGALDHPVTDDHGDYGTIPFAYISGVDIKCAGLGKRPWMSLDLLPERPLANGLKLFLKAMSRNPAGIGVLNTRGEVAGGWGGKKHTTENMAALMGIGRRFGDLLGLLERRDEIAILSSFSQAALGAQSDPKLWGAHFALSKAGYQAAVVGENEALADAKILDRYKAVMLVGVTAPLQAAVSEALRRFQAAGGTLIADEETKSDLPGIVRVPVAELRGANEVDFRKVYGEFAPLAARCRETLRGRVTPFATASREHVHLMRSVDADLEYWTLFHDGLPSSANVGGHFAQFLYEGAEATLSAKARGVLYDALNGTTVVTRARDGGIEWDADMRRLPGTFYLLAPRAADRLAVEAPRSVRRGQLLRLRAALLDASGRAFAGRVPVEIALREPDGRERDAIYRTTNAELLLKVAGNDPAGEWSWRATDQATGLRAEGRFTVEGEEVAPRVAVCADTVFDAPAIHDALRGRDFDIVLYPRQAGLREASERLAASLAKAGCRARARTMAPSRVRPYPMNWQPHTVEDEEVFGAVTGGEAVGLREKGKNQQGTRASTPDMAFYGQFVGSAAWVYARDVILLGRGDQPGNPMFDLVARHCRMLPRNPSASFPAAGRGLVGYAWAPFHYGHDAIVAFGQDERGLDRAIAAVAELAAGPRPAAAFVPRPAGGSGDVYRAMGLAADGSALLRIEGRSRTALRLLPAVHDLESVDAEGRDDRLFVKQTSRGDAKTAPFVRFDLPRGTRAELQSDDGAVRRSAVSRCAANAGRAGWLAEPRLPVGEGDVMAPVGRGLARIGADGSRRWFYEPHATVKTYAEARYERRCQNIVLSDDGRTGLATFYDVNAGGGYGPTFRMMLEGVTVLLDAESGREICRYPGYCTGRAALAADGSRCIVVDDVIYDFVSASSRAVMNPHGEFVVAAFGRDGRETWHLPVSAVDRFASDRMATRAAVSYADARRYVSLLDCGARREARVGYDRADVGVAVAPDGAFAVVAYADGLVRKVSFEGTVLGEARLPASGAPVVAAGNRVLIACMDGTLRAPFEDSAVVALQTVSPERLPPPAAPPAGQRPPQRPFWRELPTTLPLKAGGAAPWAAGQTLTGERVERISLPPAAGLSTALFTFQYRLKEPTDRLVVSYGAAGRTNRFEYPYAAEPRSVALPFRPGKPGEVAVTFGAAGGVEVDGGRLQVLDLSDWANVAYAPADRSGRNMPRAMIPNIDGCLGDPRVEQMAYFFPKQAAKLLTGDLAGAETRVELCFDGNVHSATPLYPAATGGAPWHPWQSRPTMRSAQVVMEFPKPVGAAAVGVWERANDKPVRAFALEYCDRAVQNTGSSKSLDGNWQLALAAFDNTDYYHVHAFKAPIAARFWRYTILETEAAVQSVAEIELYATALDETLDGLE